MAHAGDGNLYPVFVFDREQAQAGAPDNAWAAAGKVLRTALEVGSTLTGSTASA